MKMRSFLFLVLGLFVLAVGNSYGAQQPAVDPKAVQSVDEIIAPMETLKAISNVSVVTAGMIKTDLPDVMAYRRVIHATAGNPPTQGTLLFVSYPEKATGKWTVLYTGPDVFLDTLTVSYDKSKHGTLSDFNAARGATATALGFVSMAEKVLTEIYRLDPQPPNHVTREIIEPILRPIVAITGSPDSPLVSSALMAELARIYKANPTAMSLDNATDMLLLMYRSGKPSNPDLDVLRAFLKTTDPRFVLGNMRMGTGIASLTRTLLGYGLPENVDSIPDAAIGAAIRETPKLAIPLIMLRSGETSKARLLKLWRAEEDALIAEGGEFPKLKDHVTSWMTKVALATPEVRAAVAPVLYETLSSANRAAAKPAPAWIVDLAKPKP